MSWNKQEGRKEGWKEGRKSERWRRGTDWVKKGRKERRMEERRNRIKERREEGEGGREGGREGRRDRRKKIRDRRDGGTERFEEEKKEGPAKTDWVSFTPEDNRRVKCVTGLFTDVRIGTGE